MSLQSLVSTFPVSRLNEDWWKERHAHCQEVTKAGGVDVVFLGDSITQGWEGSGKATWDKYYAGRKAANFGFSGDRTEHVLWRLDQGEIIGLKPKVVVIMIGTNNIGHGSSNASATAEGVSAIVSRLRKGVPDAKILLLNIFPRDREATDSLRMQVADASAQFQKLGDERHVFCRDIGHHFVRLDGSLRSLLMPDFLHLNPAGYEIWAKAMEPELKALLGEK
ncbi:MAG: hypothetical protein K8R88_05590 [Armatimonadetes bacterium]|nr:hypothetical protein [Armatimonadota bacterium]